MQVVRVIQNSSKDDRGFSVTICETTGHHKYVTWLVDAEGNRHYGDYFAKFKDALQGYIDRCEENKVEA